MSQTDRAPLRLSKVVASVLLLCAMIGAMLASLPRIVPFDDDRAYLYVTNYTVSAPNAFDAEGASWSQALRAAGYDAETLARFDFRHRFTNNYVGQSVALAAIRQVWTPPLDETRPAWIRAVIILSGALTAAIAVALTLWAFLRLDERQRAAALSALTGLAVISFFPDLPGHRVSNNIDLLYPVRALAVLVQPGVEFMPFAIQCRSVATLLLVAAVLARWRGPAGLVYWMVFAAAVFHGTHGALILLLMVGLDAALDPKRLWKIGSLIPIALTAAWAAKFGVSFGGLTGASTGLVSFLGLLGLLLAASLVPMGRVAPVRMLRALSPRMGEALVLILAIVVLLIGIALAAGQVVGLERSYILGELSGRALSLLRIPLALAVAAIVLDWLPEKAERLVVGAAAALAIVLVPAGLFLLSQRLGPVPTEAEILAHLPAAQANGMRASPDTERAIYYTMARTLDGGARP